MATIIAQPGRHAHPNPDAAARQRRDRLARATTGQMESALAFLSMIDPQAFEIAFTAVTPAAGQSEDVEAISLCRRCGALIAIFPDRSLRWQHFRDDGTASGTRETYDSGHAAAVAWILPDEGLEEL
jgi:hypothetical protein